jgi:hypothetical protein
VRKSFNLLFLLYPASAVFLRRRPLAAPPLLGRRWPLAAPPRRGGRWPCLLHPRHALPPAQGRRPRPPPARPMGAVPGTRLPRPTVRQSLPASPRAAASPRVLFPGPPRLLRPKGAILARGCHAPRSPSPARACPAPKVVVPGCSCSAPTSPPPASSASSRERAVWWWIGG